MKKALVYIILFLLVSVQNAYSQEGDWVKELRNKLALYYSKNLPVNLHLLFNQPAYAPGDTAYFKISFLSDRDNMPVKGRQVINVNLLTRKGIIVHHQKVLINDGFGFNQLAIPASIDPGVYVVVAYSDWMKNQDHALFYYSDLFIAGEREFVKENSPSLELYPECGNIVSGVSNKVVVLGKPGAEVIVEDNNKIQAAKCVLDSLGMGFFSIAPTLNGKYVASDGSITKALPEALRDKVSMSVTQTIGTKNFLNVNLEVNDCSTVTQNFYFAVTSRSKVYYAAMISFKDRNLVNIVVPQTLFPEGVMLATLFKADKSVEAERLFLVDHKSGATLSSSLNKKVYDVREKVVLNLSLNSTAVKSLKSRLGLTVYNEDLFSESEHNNSVPKVMNRTENLSYGGLLPEFTKRMNAQAWDNILITQSWKKFNWSDVWGERSIGNHAFKNNLHFAGRVLFDDAAQPMDSTTISFFLQHDIRTYDDLLGKDGTFDFSLFFDFAGREDVYYTVEEYGKTLKGAKVELFEDDTFSLNLPLFAPGNQQSQYGNFAITRNEIESAYKVRSNEGSNVNNTNPHAQLEDEIYGADVSIELSEYMILPTMEETLREIIPLLQHRWRNEKHTVRVRLTEPDAMGVDDPAYFIDGVLTNDTDYFMSLKPSGCIHH